MHSRDQGVFHFSAATVCTKLVQLGHSDYNKSLGLYSLFPNWFTHEIREYATLLLIQSVPNLFSRSILILIKVLAPTVFFLQFWFIHEIREDSTFLLLQFVPKLLSRSILSQINVWAPTVCFKIHSFTRSGRIQLFCSYILYQSCSVEVFWV